MFIHQLIKTIEFILGSVSNTASYLRLWALSLAHYELSHVFAEMTILEFLKDSNVIFMLLLFYIFAGVTTGIIMFMDLLECFLHTLRLHW